jgi:hypothetical protein
VQSSAQQSVVCAVTRTSSARGESSKRASSARFCADQRLTPAGRKPAEQFARNDTVQADPFGVRQGVKIVVPGDGGLGTSKCQPLFDEPPYQGVDAGIFLSSSTLERGERPVLESADAELCPAVQAQCRSDIA